MAADGGARRWWILAAMTGTLSMMMLDSTVVSVALPSIQADLDLSQTELQWVVNAYLLALAAFVAVAGRISDMFNRVRVMILGVAIFVFFSAMCGLAQSDAWLIGSRALQGIGAALMIPPTATIVINTFGVEERGKAMGIYAGISMIFLSLGPLIGGVFTESLDWRWVFWINLPVGLVTIAMVLWTKPDGRVEAGQRLDWPGLLTLVPGLTLLVLGFMEASNWGWGSAKTIGAIGVGAVLLVAFALIERRARQPARGAAPVRRQELQRRHDRPVLRPVRAHRADDLRRDLHAGHPRLHPDRGRPGHAARDPAAARGGAAVRQDLRQGRPARARRRPARSRRRSGSPSRPPCSASRTTGCSSRATS